MDWSQKQGIEPAQWCLAYEFAVSIHGGNLLIKLSFTIWVSERSSPASYFCWQQCQYRVTYTVKNSIWCLHVKQCLYMNDVSTVDVSYIWLKLCPAIFNNDGEIFVFVCACLGMQFVHNCISLWFQVTWQMFGACARSTPFGPKEEGLF